MTMTKHDLKQLRKALGLSQEKLARALGWTTSSVSKKESGARPISEADANLVRLTVKELREGRKNA